jgi:hypothetical protein
MPVTAAPSENDRPMPICRTSGRVQAARVDDDRGGCVMGALRVATVNIWCRHVLAGDFDAGPDTASVRFWTGRQSLGDLSVNYQDAWEFAHPDESGHTFTLENPLIVSEADWSRIPPRRKFRSCPHCRAASGY